MRHRLIVLFLAVAVLSGGELLILAPSAWAVPSFARAYQMSCSACHTAWPALNATGRKFKENGYMLERGSPKGIQKITEALHLPVAFPFAMVVKSRPFDQKRADESSMLRALHELELFVAGSVFNQGSFFAEFEMEDEENFEFEMGHAVGGYHPHPLLNLVVGKSHVFHVDPHDTLTNARRLTRSSRQAWNQGFSTGVKLQEEVQMVSLYGRETLADKLFYSVTYSADVDDNEGQGPKDWTGRLVLDILPDLSLGAFLSGGEQRKTSGGVTEDLEFTRWGFDLQTRFQDINLLVAWMGADDDIFAGGSEQNNAWYLEAFYTVRQKALKSIGLPGFMLVPIARFDQYEKTDGKDDFRDLTLNLSWYPLENLRIYTEYFTSVDRPPDKDREWRWTVQVEFGF